MMNFFTVSETCISPWFSISQHKAGPAAVQWNQGLLREDNAVQLLGVSQECGSPEYGDQCQHRCKPANAARGLWLCFVAHSVRVSARESLHLRADHVGLSFFGALFHSLEQQDSWKSNIHNDYSRIQHLEIENNEIKHSNSYYNLVPERNYLAGSIGNMEKERPHSLDSRFSQK